MNTLRAEHPPPSFPNPYYDDNAAGAWRMCNRRHRIIRDGVGDAAEVALIDAALANNRSRMEAALSACATEIVADFRRAMA